MDNFETLIHARDNGSDEEKKTAKSLYAFFKSLAAEGVTLCVTSREMTALLGETIIEIYGLEDEIGGRLFQNMISTRKDALNETGLERISSVVGGHPLALRLLAPIFEEQAGLTLDRFVQKLETFLPKAHDKWTEEDRHESLSASFSFSMDNLPKNEEGENLKIAISKLSIFTAYFFELTAMPILENEFPKNQDEQKQAQSRTAKILRNLWEHGLLERTSLAFTEENFYLYRLHPALSFFAKERLSDNKIIKERFWSSMNSLAHIAEELISQSPLIASIVSHSKSDLLAAIHLRDDIDGLNFRYRVARLLTQFGDLDSLDSAVVIYEQILNTLSESGQEVGTR